MSPALRECLRLLLLEIHDWVFGVGVYAYRQAYGRIHTQEVIYA